MVGLDLVIVNWNAGRQLSDCLKSVEELQTEPVFRLSSCTVVDNASTDGSADDLHDNVHFLKNARNRGFGAACNQGAALGRADYILFLNPDIKLVPDSLLKAITFLEESAHRNIGLLGVQLVDDKCRIQPSAARFPTPWALLYQMVGVDRVWPALFPPFVVSNWDYAETKDVEVLKGAFLLVRRATFDVLGGFDERFFMYYEDVDLACRAEQCGWAATYYAQARAFHRGAGTTESIKASRLSYWMISRLRYVAKHFGRGAAFAVLVASLTVELGARLIWNLVGRSWEHLAETIGAYEMYVRTVLAKGKARQRFPTA